MRKLKKAKMAKARKAARKPASEALVVDIREQLTGKPVNTAYSSFCFYPRGRLTRLEYKVGKTVKPYERFDMNPAKICSSGIHFFLLKHQAEAYHL